MRRRAGPGGSPAGGGRLAGGGRAPGGRGKPRARPRQTQTRQGAAAAIATPAPTPLPTPTVPGYGQVFSDADTEEKIIAITVDDCFQAEGVAYKLKCTNIVLGEKFQEGQAADLVNDPNNPTRFHLHRSDMEERSTWATIIFAPVLLTIAVTTIVVLLCVNPELRYI